MKVVNLTEALLKDDGSQLKAALAEGWFPSAEQVERALAPGVVLSPIVRAIYEEIRNGKLKRAKRGRPEKGGFRLLLDGFFLNAEIKALSEDKGISEAEVRRQLATERNMSEEKLKDDQYPDNVLSKRYRRLSKKLGQAD